MATDPARLEVLCCPRCFLALVPERVERPEFAPRLRCLWCALWVTSDDAMRIAVERMPRAEGSL